MQDDDSRSVYELVINFDINKDSPQSAFKTLSEMIESFQYIDNVLLSPLAIEIESTILLDNISIGSLRSRFKNVICSDVVRNGLMSIDDDLISDISINRIIGFFLVKGKYLLIDFIDKNRNNYTNNNLIELSKTITQIADEYKITQIPGYHPIDQKSILESTQKITHARSIMTATDTVEFITSEGSLYIPKLAEIEESQWDELLSSDHKYSHTILILKVKKADFIGESMWEFKYEDNTYPMKIYDHDWLDKYHKGEYDLRPGDSVRAEVDITTVYDLNGEVSKIHYTITKITEIIRNNPPEQESLF